MTISKTLNTIPGVKKLFGHSWWLDALIIVGILAILFIICRIVYKSIKKCGKNKNKNKKYGNSDAGRKSAQTAMNRISKSIELESLEPPLIIDGDGGSDYGYFNGNNYNYNNNNNYNYNNDNNNIDSDAITLPSDNDNDSDWKSLKSTMSLAQVQQIVHELHKSEELKQTLHDAVQGALANTLKNTLNNNNNSNNNNTMHIDDFAYSQNAMNLSNNDLNRSSIIYNNNNNNNINNDNYNNNTMDEKQMESILLSPELMGIGNAPSNRSYISNGTDIDDDDLDLKDNNDENKLGELMNNVEGIFHKLKHTATNSKELHGGNGNNLHRKSTVNSEMVTPYGSDTSDDDDVIKGDLKASLKLAGMTSLFLRNLESANQQSVDTTLINIDQNDDNNDNNDNDNGNNNDNNNNNKSELHRKIEHFKSVSFQIPENEDSVIVMATVPETLSDGDNDANDIDNEEYDNDDDDEDDDGGELVFLDDM